MNGRRVPLLLAIALAFCLPSCVAAPVTFDFAHVGNAGNAGELSGKGAGGFGPSAIVGAVAYNYAISKTEVTNAQYTTFLNAVDQAGGNTLGIYHRSMAINDVDIEATGATDSVRYVARAGYEQNPVTYVKFINAMRFINWLHNGQGAGETETGVYTIHRGQGEVRSANAKYWLPSEDEWYKAAYHDASAGTAGVYFDYATGSDREPISDQPGDNPAAVNYLNDDGLANGFNDGYAVSGSPWLTNVRENLTDVGAYTAATSSYGTYDQSGNVWEWTEEVTSPGFRGLRGGAWSNILSNLRADFRAFNFHPNDTGWNFGFRVATVPEPTTLALALLAATAVGRRRLPLTAPARQTLQGSTRRRTAS